eukprot:UN32506
MMNMGKRKTYDNRSRSRSQKKQSLKPGNSSEANIKSENKTGPSTINAQSSVETGSSSEPPQAITHSISRETSEKATDAQPVNRETSFDRPMVSTIPEEKTKKFPPIAEKQMEEDNDMSPGIPDQKIVIKQQNPITRQMEYYLSDVN